ncbi:MAG: hypothetical protein EBT56_10810 [Betaproteobacteria bacterium]|nr:hypothetical protein [Betaproteobacteria bacterium]
MSTSLGNLGSIPRYDPATANQVKTSNTSIGSTAEEIQNNFMKMLVAQMQNQNPLNPMDNAEFTSQLAQMSQLQGIESMRMSIDSFVKQVSSGRLLDQSALIRLNDGRLVNDTQIMQIGSSQKLAPES